MKTNHTFDMNRFVKYVRSNMNADLRILAIYSVVAFTAIYILLILLVNRSWGKNDWEAFWVLSTIVSGILIAGTAFPQLRTRERSMGYLMIPSSATEKYAYELIFKVALSIVIFQPVFYLAANLGIDTIQRIREVQRVDYNVKTFTYETLFKTTQNGEFLLYSTIGLVLWSIAFSGAVTFRKYPLIKTVLIAGALFFSFLIYLVFVIEKLKIRMPLIIDFFSQANQLQSYTIISSILALVSIVFLTYSFFKLKEKEAK